MLLWASESGLAYTSRFLAGSWRLRLRFEDEPSGGCDQRPELSFFPRRIRESIKRDYLWLVGIRCFWKISSGNASCLIFL